MILTKKHRLVWGDDKMLLFDPREEYIDSSTYVGVGMNGFESDDYSGIENKIQEESLTYKSEQDEYND